MKTIQKIEAGLCVTIAALLAGGWIVTIGQLFFRSA
jgi:hypothetical protein